jgi:hypothetical protein
VDRNSGNRGLPTREKHVGPRRKGENDAAQPRATIVLLAGGVVKGRTITFPSRQEIDGAFHVALDQGTNAGELFPISDGLTGLMHAGCTDILGGGTCASLTSVKLPNASCLL